MRQKDGQKDRDIDIKTRRRLARWCFKPSQPLQIISDRGKKRKKKRQTEMQRQTDRWREAERERAREMERERERETERVLMLTQCLDLKRNPGPGPGYCNECRAEHTDRQGVEIVTDNQRLRAGAHVAGFCWQAPC